MIDNSNPNCSGADPNYVPTKEDIRKNGFYYYALNEKLRVFYEVALEEEGLAQEMALLRTTTEYYTLIYPLNIGVISNSLNTLKGLLKAHYSVLKKDQAVDFNQKMSNFIASIGMTNEKFKESWLTSTPAS